MSDRHLSRPGMAPIEPVERPARYSQSFLRLADNCRRGAYLYLRHGDDQVSHAMDRGTLLHAVHERMVQTLLKQGDRAFIEPDEEMLVREGHDVRKVAGRVAAVTAAIVDEVAAEMPWLTVPSAERDLVRVCAFHLAVGFPVALDGLVALERKFVLDVVVDAKPVTVSGIIDLAFAAGSVGQVDDLKTAIHVPDQERFEQSFQTKLYAAMLAFGYPVVGEGPEEAREAPLGGRLQYIRAREVYPRKLTGSGHVPTREKTYTRGELADFIAFDLAGVIRDVEWSFTESRWPAVPGSHCSTCPAPALCPIPADLNMNRPLDEEDAADAAELLDRLQARKTGLVDRLRERLKATVQASGPVRYGTDMVFEGVVGTKKETDWRALQQAVDAGQPVEDVQAVKKEKPSTTYKARKLSAEELEAEAEQQEPSLDERYGEAAPF